MYRAVTKEQLTAPRPPDGYKQPTQAERARDNTIVGPETSTTPTYTPVQGMTNYSGVPLFKPTIEDVRPSTPTPTPIAPPPSGRISIEQIRPIDTTPYVPSPIMGVIRPEPVAEVQPAPITVQPPAQVIPAPPLVDPAYENQRLQLEQDRLALEQQRLQLAADTAKNAITPAPITDASAPGGGLVTLPPDDTSSDSRIADLIGDMFSSLAGMNGPAAPVPQQAAPAVLVAPPTNGETGGGFNIIPILIIAAIAVGGYVWYRHQHE